MNESFEIYYLDNGHKKGPIKVNDLYLYNVDQETLIWYHGQEKWITIRDLKNMKNLDYLEKIPPKIPKNQLLEINKRKVSKFIIAAVKNFLKSLILLAFLMPVIFYVSLFTNYEYKLYSSVIREHKDEFKHEIDEYGYCSLGEEIPEYINKSPLLKFNDDSQFYDLSKPQLISNINDLSRIFGEHLSLTDKNSIYEQIRCIYHNRSLTYISVLKQQLWQESLLIAIGIILLFKFCKFLYKITKTLIKYNN